MISNLAAISDIDTGDWPGAMVVIVFILMVGAVVITVIKRSS